AQSAHDNFWDFVSLSPESTHMLMWVMSDRAIPRSYRMMEGFGVHSFRFVNEKGKACFVKFHWKPLLGVHSIVWDEAQRISGVDPDFHRRDLWESIENGDFPEWELGVQIVEEKDEFSFDFDILDPTKLIPEEIVPVQRIGKLTLNRNPDNFFAETEQVAFHLGNIVTGIDFTNDPLLQGRLFSYTDTQLLRLGGPNFHEIPINRPIAPVHNNQRDGLSRQTINRGTTAHIPNSVAGGCPFQAGKDMRGFISYAEKVDGNKIRDRSKSFLDHYTQARMFWLSMSEPEQNHIVQAFSFELSKCVHIEIQERMLLQLAQVDADLCARVAVGLGLKPKAKNAKVEPYLNMQVPSTANPKDYQSVPTKMDVAPSPILSIVNAPPSGIRTRKVAALAADGVREADITKMKNALKKEGAQLKIVGAHAGVLKTLEGTELPVDHALFSSSSVTFDAVFVPGGEESVETLLGIGKSVHFINEAFKHLKTVGASGEGTKILQKSCIGEKLADAPGVVSGKGDVSKAFIEAMYLDRHWTRELDIEPPV
ncbi:MAG: catalase, partial [Leptolyngbya sp.]|nr:catalase [Candidatus Melainabacteria bacterium]